ncbi:MAG: hypothetical protein WD397_16245 [Wenzhouxiangellaceae bacterium]
MKSVAQLDQLEQRAYRRVVDHGALDVWIGAALVTVGLMLHADLDYMPAIAFFVGALAFEQIRRRLIESRIGHVRLRADRMARLKTWRWLTLTALIVAVFGVVALRSLGWIDYPNSAGPLIVTGCLALPLALAGGLFGIRRWFVYAAVVFTGGVCEAWLDLAYGSSFYFSGGLVVSAGLVLLVRFVRCNPSGNGNSDGA